jgi:hypothetical protein
MSVLSPIIIIFSLSCNELISCGIPMSSLFVSESSIGIKSIFAFNVLKNSTTSDLLFA